MSSVTNGSVNWWVLSLGVPITIFIVYSTIMCVVFRKRVCTFLVSCFCPKKSSIEIPQRRASSVSVAASSTAPVTRQIHNNLNVERARTTSSNLNVERSRNVRQQSSNIRPNNTPHQHQVIVLSCENRTYLNSPVIGRVCSSNWDPPPSYEEAVKSSILILPIKLSCTTLIFVLLDP